MNSSKTKVDFFIRKNMNLSTYEWKPAGWMNLEDFLVFYTRSNHQNIVKKTPRANVDKKIKRNRKLFYALQFNEIT